MITHDKAKATLKYAILMRDWYLPEVKETFEKYIAQQEKVSKLLELYREHMTTLCKNAREGVKDSMFSSEFVAYKLYQQIQALEEELK